MDIIRNKLTLDLGVGLFLKNRVSCEEKVGFVQIRLSFPLDPKRSERVRIN